MERTLEELIAAINQIRKHAAGHEGKRKAFFDRLHAMLSTPIREDEHYAANVKRMYLAAIGALTFEIQPPTTDTYDAVLEKINSALDGERLGPIRIALYPDREAREGYATIGVNAQQDPTMARVSTLRDDLPQRRKLTRTQRALVDRFRTEIRDLERPFQAREQQGG